MGIHESGENYIETIYMLKKNSGDVRSVDIAQKLGYTKPSISRAMGLLKKAGYITIDRQGHIEFTEKGLNKAKQIYERHMVLTKFFINSIGLDEESAEAEACKIEHIITPQTFDKIKDYVGRAEKTL